MCHWEHVEGDDVCKNKNIYVCVFMFFLYV